jgi:VIT1/CCC1 family predicted Fe2+/Mn2+ transporter
MIIDLMELMMKKESRFDLAKKSFENKDIELHKKAHSREIIAGEAWHKTTQGRYMGSVVYGASDGIITTFAVVAGAMGAHLNPQIVLIMGFANLFGDGFSMAMGDYLSHRTTAKYDETERKREEWEVEIDPQSEKEEMFQIYKERGISDEKARALVDLISSDKRLWVDTMMHEELGILEEKHDSPVKDALVTFLSFVLFGFMPLITYVLASFIPLFEQNTFVIATILTLMTLFTVGAIRKSVTGGSWIKSGVEMLLMGSAAAFVAYIVGFLIRSIT